nr:chimeric PRRSV GP5 ecto and EAV GP5 TM and Endo [Cloning vector prMLVB4/5 GP5ecto]AFO73535.1 chimeric EAV/PRRSV GP5 [Cloning vector pEAVrMLVB4/5/6 GP5&Mecto]
MLGKCLTAGCCSQLLFLWCIVPFCFVALVNANNSSSSHLQLIYNLTICELNGTDWLNRNFDWAVEFGIVVLDVFMFYPVLVLFFLSVLPYATLILEMCVSILFIIYGIYSGAYLAMGIFSATLAIHSIVVLRQLLWLCLAWRYRCTLHASFISAEGKVYPVDPELPVAAAGNRLLVPGRPTIDYAVAYGSKVNLVRLGAAEVWEP